MPNITQTVKCISTGFAVSTVIGVLAGNAVIAATGEEHRRPAWRETISTTEANSDAQGQKIIEIVESKDGTLGIILFGNEKSVTTDTTRRGPR